jgi:hypothetical protein
VWLRKKRFRTSKNPFIVDHVDPVSLRLDHEHYGHFTEPYRSYNSIYEFCDEWRVDRSPARTVTALVGGLSFRGEAPEGTEGGGDPEGGGTAEEEKRARTVRCC